MPPQARYPSTLVPNPEVSQRNILTLLPALLPYLSLPTTSRVLELASGPGIHIQAYSKQCPEVTFVPSECDEYGLEQLKAVFESSGKEAQVASELKKGKVGEAVKLDVMEDEDWERLVEITKEETDRFDLVIGANFLHMIPFPEGAEKIFTHLSAITSSKHEDVHFCVYGPFKSSTGFFSESDSQFDASIKARPNGHYLGLRPLEELEEIAKSAPGGWRLKERIEMPKGNFVLVFHKFGG